MSAPHDGAPHDGARHDGARHDGARHDGARHDDAPGGGGAGARGRRPGRPRPSIEEGPPSLLYTVKQVELAVRTHLDELLKPAEITALQYTALTVLGHRDGLSLTELAQNSFVKVQSMADVVRPLHDRGLIERHPDPTHGRRQLISATRAGLDLLDEHEDAVRALERRMLAPMTDAEAALLRDLLARCRTALA